MTTDEESNVQVLAAIGRRLRSVRRTLGETSGGDMSQGALAKELSVHRNTIVALENGDRDVSGYILRVLLERFGIDPAWVLLGPGDRPRKLNRYVDEDRLILAAQRADREIEEERLDPTPEQRWRLVAALYDLLSDPLDEANPSVKKLLRFAGR